MNNLANLLRRRLRGDAAQRGVRVVRVMSGTAPAAAAPGSLAGR